MGVIGVKKKGEQPRFFDCKRSMTEGGGVLITLITKNGAVRNDN